VTAVELASRWARADVDIDPWGCQAEAQDVVDAVIRQMIRVRVVGGRHLPASGGALLVANRRFGVLEPMAVGRAVRQEVGRRMRFTGLPDVAPVGTPLRRLGVVVSRPAEVAALLRAGHLVGLPLAVELRSRMRAGNLCPENVAPALQEGVPILPVAVVGGELTGRWTVHIGSPVPSPKARGPLALAEAADDTQHAIQALLDDAFPPRWPWS
jgi:1-acyl-sn-glycerol-3-phosphate acyltransferase